MKKLLYTVTIILLTLVIFYQHSVAQDRTPVYIHGHDPNTAVWANWRTVFNQERRIFMGTNTDYSSNNASPINQGVANFAARVTIPTNNNTILFGHSTGGMVIRHIDLFPTSTQSQNQFGGIITTGSAMDGARIANSIINGQAASFIVNGVSKILTGPIRQFGATVGVLYAVAGHTFKSLAEDDVNRLLIDMQGGATTNDIAEGSTYMNSGIRAMTTSKPKIHIYGNENSPVIWRFASIAAGFSTDTELVGVTQQAADVCQTAKAVSIASALLTPWNAIQDLWRADGWGISANWINNTSETGWNDLIGASTPASYTVSYEALNQAMFNQCLASYGQSISYAQYMACRTQNTFTEFYTYYSPVNGQSDGLIKAPSATGYNSAYSNNATKIEALGVNHKEMKNHAVMKGIYDGIYDGTRGANSFFNTLRR